MSDASFSPGDIVLIEHRPLDDPSAAKVRPVVVVSNASFNRGNIDVVVVVISSVIRYRDSLQILISDSDPGFSDTGLKRTSVVKCGALFACPKSIIRRRLGRTSTAVLAQIRHLLTSFLLRD
jgi:mRNA-degrading endonuclease toxin of MazEF toxin-antitoxin module